MANLLTVAFVFGGVLLLWLNVRDWYSSQVIISEHEDAPVPDRPGHDRRYSLDTTKLRELGWRPEVPFVDGLKETVEWYAANEWWWRPIKQANSEFQSYYAAQYGDRLRRS